MAAKKIHLTDNPPDGRNVYRLDWDAMDEVALVLIDNPGKWALMLERPKVEQRSVNIFYQHYGNAFKFKTYKNPDTDTLEIWASYIPDEEE